MKVSLILLMLAHPAFIGVRGSAASTATAGHIVKVLELDTSTLASNGGNRNNTTPTTTTTDSRNDEQVELKDLLQQMNHRMDVMNNRIHAVEEEKKAMEEEYKEMMISVQVEKKELKDRITLLEEANKSNKAIPIAYEEEEEEERSAVRGGVVGSNTAAEERQDHRKLYFGHDVEELKGQVYCLAGATYEIVGGELHRFLPKHKKFCHGEVHNLGRVAGPPGYHGTSNNRRHLSPSCCSFVVRLNLHCTQHCLFHFLLMHFKTEGPPVGTKQNCKRCVFTFINCFSLAHSLCISLSSFLCYRDLRDLLERRDIPVLR